MLLHRWSHVAFGFFFFAGGLQAQPWDGGRPPFEYIDPASYGGHSQNWMAAEDGNGFIYVANGSGVLVFDGARWERIPLPGGGVVRSISVDATNTLFVGGLNEFGFLAPDEAGRLHYHSLVGEIESDVDVGEIWGVAAQPDGVYFQSNRALYRWHNGKLSVIPTESFFHTLFQTGGGLYVTVPGDGVARVLAEEVVPLQNGGEFGHIPLFSWEALGAETFLAGTYNNELYLFDRTNSRRLHTEADDWMEEYGGSAAIPLSNGTIAIGTMGDGLRVVDTNGRLVGQLDAASGLGDGSVNELFASRSGDLWLLLNNGLARAVVPSPVSFFDERVGIHGTAAVITRFNGSIFVGTERGLFRLDPPRASARSPKFEQVLAGVNVWDAVSTGDVLIVLTNNGAYEWSGDRIIHRDQGTYNYTGHYSDRHPDRFLIGTDEGFAVLHRGDRGWQYPAVTVEGVGKHSVRTIVEDDSGFVWLGTYTGVVYRLSLGDTRVPDVRTFARDHGVPAGEVDVSLVDGRVVLSTTEGVFVYDHEQERFVDPGSCIVPPGATDRYVEFAIQVASGEVIVGRGEQPGTRLASVRNPLSADCEVDESVFATMPAGAYHTAVVDGHVVWIGGAEGVVRYDLSQVRSAPPRQAMVRQVTWGDSLLFASVGGVTGRGVTTVLPYSSRRLTFAVAAPGVPARTRIEYSGRLMGVDEDWTPWTETPGLEYTSVPPATYRFEVRARRAGGPAGAAAVFDFEILPPWYRTWWAYGFYALFVLGTIIPATRYVSQRRLQRQIQRLEAERRIQAERERISRDLHDNVGAQLSNIMSGIELIHLSTKAGEHVRAQEYLAGLDDDVKITMELLRETIWALHQDTVTVNDLRARIHHFIESRIRYRDSVSISCEVVGDGAFELSPVHALHLYRIAQESITNSLKHSGAEEVRVRLEVVEGRLLLTISDDGTFRVPDGKRELSGFGLRGMETRAREIGADFSLHTDAGTQVRVELPRA